MPVPRPRCCVSSQRNSEYKVLPLWAMRQRRGGGLSAPRLHGVRDTQMPALRDVPVHMPVHDKWSLYLNKVGPVLPRSHIVMCMVTLSGCHV